MKAKLITLLKISISLGLMIYLGYRFLSAPQDRAVLLTTLATTKLPYLGLALALYMLAVITNATKWYILLRAQGVPVPFMPLVKYTFVGFFFNNFLPANVGGDVMRGFGLARYTERNAEAAVSVIVDRIIGLMAFMATAVVAALLATYLVPAADGALADSLAQIELIAVLGLFAILSGFALMLSQRLREGIGQLVARTPLIAIYRPVSDALGAYRTQYRALLIAFGVGVVTVLLTGLVDIALVAGLGGEIAPIYIFLLNPIIAVALIAPISVGGLGAGSALYIYFYGLVGVPEPLAFALSLFKQATIYLGSLPGGFWWWQSRHASPQEAATEWDKTSAAVSDR